MLGRPFSSFSSLCRVAVLLAALVALGAGVATAQNADPAGFVPLGDRLYFFATDPLNGRELWATDGTEAGTELVIDLCPGPCSSNPDSLIAAQGQLFWIADDGVSGAEPWTSDGTVEGTHPLRDICPGACGSLAATPRSLVAAGRFVYFGATPGTSAQELWRTDGSAAGTVRVAAIGPGTAHSRLGQLTAFGG